MRILMLSKCKSCHTSWEVRTLTSHTDKKYTVTRVIVWCTGTCGQSNAAATGFRLIKLCDAQGHASFHTSAAVFFQPELCHAQGRKPQPTTQKPHPVAVSANGMRLELCGAQGHYLLFQCLILPCDFFRQFTIGFKPADFCQYALRPTLCDHVLDLHRFFVFCVIE